MGEILPLELRLSYFHLNGVSVREVGAQHAYYVQCVHTVP